MSERKKNKPGQGRPKGTTRKPPTDIISYRAPTDDIEKAKRMYKEKLPGMHGDWLKEIISEPKDKDNG